MKFTSIILIIFLLSIIAFSPNTTIRPIKIASILWSINALPNAISEAVLALSTSVPPKNEKIKKHEEIIKTVASKLNILSWVWVILSTMTLVNLHRKYITIIAIAETPKIINSLNIILKLLICASSKTQSQKDIYRN